VSWDKYWDKKEKIETGWLSTTFLSLISEFIFEESLYGHLEHEN
jgi:hypothetical protein